MTSHVISCHVISHHISFCDSLIPLVVGKGSGSRSGGRKNSNLGEARYTVCFDKNSKIDNSQKNLSENFNVKKI